MSPKYGFGTQVSTRSTRLSSLIVPLTRYLPSAVNDTMVSGRPSSINWVAEASSASAAAFRKPCGDIQMSSWRTSALAGLGHGVVAGQRPGVLAGGEENTLLLPLQGRAAAQRRIVALAAVVDLVRRAMAVADGAIVGGHLEPGPVVGRRVALPYVGDPSGAGVADRAHVAHGLRGGLQHFIYVLGRRRRRQRAHGDEKSKHPTHRSLPAICKCLWSRMIVRRSRHRQARDTRARSAGVRRDETARHAGARAYNSKIDRRRTKARKSAARPSMGGVR